MVEYWTRSCSCSAGEGHGRSGRCSVLLAPLFHFISAAVTGGSSPLLFLTVSPPFSGELLEMSLCSILWCPSLILVPCLSSPQCFLFSLCWLCFHLLESSLFCSLLLPLSLLFMLICRCLLLSLFPRPCMQTSAALSDRLSAAASQGYVKHETRKEVSGWHVIDASWEIFKAAINSVLYNVF